MIIGLVLLVLIYCVLPVNADEIAPNNYTINVGNTEKITPNISSNQTLTSDEIGKAKLAAIAPFQDYGANMTKWQRKIYTDLLYLIDPNFPSMGMTREQSKQVMRNHHQLMNADETIKTFGISQTPKQFVGDHVYVYITVNSSVSTHTLESYITNITNRDAKGRIVAWVDLNNLEKIASLDEVYGIFLVNRGDTSSFNLNGSVTASGDHILYHSISKTPPTAITSVTTTNPVSTTQAASLSPFSVCAAISCVGVIFICRRIGKT